MPRTTRGLGRPRPRCRSRTSRSTSTRATKATRGWPDSSPACARMSGKRKAGRKLWRGLARAAREIDAQAAAELTEVGLPSLGDLLLAQVAVHQLLDELRTFEFE